MHFTNDTEFPAKFLSGSTGEREMVGIAVAKVTYALANGALAPVEAEQAWPVFDKPFDFAGVSFQTELDFRKQGVDVLVFGKATAANGEPVRQMRAAVEWGRLGYEATVIGDRVWEKSLTGLVPSVAEPFTEMPLTNDRAYGGVANFDGQEMPHAINPDGKGFCVAKEEAPGKALPNLERPDSLIRKWNDQPKPACFFKPTGLLNLPDPSGKSVDDLLPPVLETLFNQAVPGLIARPEDPGDRLCLVGFSADGDIVFPSPPLEGFTAHVSVGGAGSRFGSRLSTVVVLAAERVVVATYRCLFRYLFSPMERRAVTIRWPGERRVAPVRR